MAIRPDDTTERDAQQAASTGIRGLDEILRGGFPRGDMHLVHGAAGTGKTTLALQFLLAGITAGESGLYITLSQTKRGLEAIAHSHGWSLSGVTVHELSPGSLVERAAVRQTVLHTAEVELGELTAELGRLIQQAKPRRAVFDSLGVIDLLAGSKPRYHREIVGLRQFLTSQGCTALFIGDCPDERAIEGGVHNEFQSLAGSLIQLEQMASDYGAVRRRVRVLKVRGVPFQSGYHDFVIRTGGLEVFPRLGLYTPEYQQFRPVRSGIETLDKLLGGGLDKGTTCLVVGPAGAGKSTLTSIYCRSAAEDGDLAAVFLFDERPETWKARAKGVGIDLEPHLSSGRILLEQPDPAAISPGEFAQHVRDAVERRGAKVVVIDSLTGYFNAMSNTPTLIVQMHELLTFLSRHGVLSMLIVAQEGFMSIGSRSSNLDVSYLSDTIIVVPMFETDGTVRRCLTAVKKRQGEHETTIRELFIRPGSVGLGEEPLRQLRNILSGNPEPRADGWKGSDGG